MDYSVKTTEISKVVTPCLAVGIYQGDKSIKGPLLSEAAQAVNRASDQHLQRIIALGDFKGEANSSQILYDVPGVKAQRIMLVGLGSQSELKSSKFRSATQNAIKVAIKSGLKSLDLALVDGANEDPYRAARNMIEGAGEATYQYTETKSGKTLTFSLGKVSVVANKSIGAAVRKGVNHGAAIAKGIECTKTLGNLPGNICTPTYLAKQAKVLEKTYPIKTTVLDEAEMKRKKMGSLLSVSRGSREPAKLIVMEYKGGKKSERPVVLVGKGLTFDAGGISIKPASAMDEMKYDMCGGATVFGAMVAAAEMGLKQNIVGIVPSSENLPDGAANKPGDIVTSMSGTTIEILNTDAEGRLILCDALTYAERFKPAAVIDIATLTGACIIALGHHASGLFCDNEELAQSLLSAGERSDDRAWRMPMWEDYSKQLKSNFADLANIGGRSAGSVTAACFLKHFTKKFDWAHLDIAGTAWNSGSAKGATGRPVPMLVEYLLDR